MNVTIGTLPIGLMIDLHHRFRTCKNADYPLVEVFRKGDWVDASMGWRRFGLSRKLVKEVSFSKFRFP